MSACIVIDSVLLVCIIVCVYCLLVSYYWKLTAMVASVCRWCVWLDDIASAPLHIIVLVGCVYCLVVCALSCLRWGVVWCIVDVFVFVVACVLVVCDVVIV